MDDSPFALLPRKLRDRIYGLVLCQSEKLLIYIENKQLHALPVAPRKHFLALTAVCKTIRVESIAVFYSNNSFLISTLAFDDPWNETDQSLTRTEILHRQFHLAHEDTAMCSTFESKQHQWVSSITTWLNNIGSANAACLRKVEISLGIWHLQKPTKHDGTVALALGNTTQLFNNQTECKISMRIGIPTSSNTPDVVDLALPTTDAANATQILRNLFMAKLSHSDRLWSQNKTSSIAFRMLKRDILYCQQRLERFMQAIEGPTPQWTTEDSGELYIPLSSIPLGSGDQGRGQRVNNGSSKGRNAITGHQEGSQSAINPNACITCVRDIAIARESRDRSYQVLPPPIPLRDPDKLDSIILDGETITTISSPLTPGGSSTSSTKRYSKTDVARRATKPRARTSKVLGYSTPSAGAVLAMGGFPISGR